MFNNLLTSIGIGSIKADTHIENNINYENDLIKGVVILEGGNTDQKVNKIEIILIERIQNDDKTSQFSEVDNELDTYIYAGEFMVRANEVETVPFQFKLENHEIDVENNKIYLKTHVFIDHSVDAYDEDEILVYNSK
ncbi:sporulation protein [Mammaliicoccus fleurettii]|uniref:Sporulation protein n=1 Tax=Mammaliicoccus fleurettii TaxID=150056 RepID=A0ABS5MLM3_9STAP|nr:sporulation protein [Mammaliicoccus fleurettii]MBL0847009.1 sporulation protein [Mammaliicoccus fleurettii]MBS3671733.1 sporulation protein [Mammaliicoccus fleurettii]MBS3696769.1 sporulation protein [Mammaliicoccus fleurettii]